MLLKTIIPFTHSLGCQECRWQIIIKKGKSPNYSPHMDSVHITI
jgi:hypothetical protein